MGISSDNLTRTQFTRVFAGDRSRPEPIFQDPARLYSDLFGATSADPAVGAGRRRALFDSLRHDIKRLESSFAGSERAKLDSYLGQINEIDRRQTAVAALGCKPGFAPATMTLACGLTNVVGVSNCNGNPHSHFGTWSKMVAGTDIPVFGPNIGHDPPAKQGPAMDLFHDWNASLIAGMARSLAAIPEGNGTALDNTVIVYMSDNGEAHHAGHHRWPLFLLGGAGGRLRTDGRFLRYPKRGSAGSRSMGDVFTTIATAVGASNDLFGKGGFEPVTGTLPEILI